MILDEICQPIVFMHILLASWLNNSDKPEELIAFLSKNIPMILQVLDC